jgi:tetratricopeptide (TPR) repeat protein
MSHEYQGWNNCGAVSVEMVLSYYGIERGQYEVAAVLRPYKDDRHVGTDEMLDYLRAEGLEGRVLVNGNVERLQEFIAAGIPVIIRTILQPGDDIAHYVVIRGYDRAAHTVIANDSYYGPDHVITEEALEELWAPLNHAYIPVYRPEQGKVVCRILGDDCNEQAMYRRAEEAAQAWTQRSPADAYAWYSLGDDLLALGQAEAALEAYGKAEAIGLPPRTYWYRFGPFEARLAAGRYQELLSTSQAVLETLPCIEELCILRGRAYEALGQRDKAVEEYRLAFEYHTNYRPAVEALRRLGVEPPPTPTPTPLGTPNIPSTLVPVPTTPRATATPTPQA